MRSFSILILFTVVCICANPVNGQTNLHDIIHNQMDDTETLIPQDFIPGDIQLHGTKKAALEDFGDAPGWIWLKQFGGSGGNYGRAVTSDVMGNIYLAANFAGKMFIGNDTLTGTGIGDLLVMKLSQTGFPLWYKHFPAPPLEMITVESIHLDNAGNILVAGEFDLSSINLGGTVLTRTGDQDVFIIKINSSGVFQWAKSFGETDFEYTGSIVRSDAARNYYLAFYDAYHSLLNKYSQSGQLLETKTRDGCRYDAFDMDENAFYFSGAMYQWVDLGDTNFFTETRGMYILKTGHDHAKQWLVKSEHMDFGYCQSLDMEVKSNGNIVVAGLANRNLIWDGDTSIFEGFRKLFITDISPSGQVNWTNLSDPHVTSLSHLEITLDDADNIYLSGYVSDTIYLSGLEIPERDFIMKSDPDGNGIWAKSIDQPTSSIQNYGSDKFTLTGISQKGLMTVSRYNSSFIEEFTYTAGGNTGSGSIYGLETDSGANLFAYGSFGISSTMDFFGTEIKDFSAGFLSKLTSRGELAWTEFIQGGGGIAMNLGNTLVYNEFHHALFLVGRINDTLVIGTETLTGEEGNMFVAKYADDGTFGWVRLLKGFDIHTSVSTDQMGNVIVTTQSQLEVSVGDSTFMPHEPRGIYLSKFDINGNFKWAIPVRGSGNAWCGATSTDENNMIYFAGEVHPGDIDFNGTLINTVNQSEGDVVIAKLDPDGNPLWIKTFGNTDMAPVYRENTWPTDIKTDPEGYSYIYGWHGDSTWFDDFLLTNDEASHYYLSYFVARIDPAGNALWARSIHMRNYDYNYNEMDIDESGSLYVMARYRDTLLFGDEYTLVNQGEKDLFIAKYKVNGDLAWVKSMEGFRGYNLLSGIAVIDSLSLYAGGYFYTSLQFDETQLVTTGRDGFIGLLSPGRLNCDEFTIGLETTSEITCHGGENGSARVNVTNGLEPVNYAWDDISESDSSSVTGLAADRYYHVTVSDAMGCVARDSIKLDEPDPIEISKTFSDLVCPGETDGFIDITVSGGTSPLVFTWSNDASTEDLAGLKPGEYHVDVLDDNGCMASDIIMLDSVAPYQGSELCLVTVNNRNKIMVVWEKTYDKGIQTYRLYREKSKDNYIFIKELHFDSLSVYVDEASTPKEFAHYYKIKAVDACGNESEFSPYHKSIKLFTSVGINNEVTLNWEEYEGFDYSEYKIFRGHTLNDLHEIRTISSNSKSWTDPDPPSGLVYYRVEVVKEDPCFPSMYKAEEYGSTVSNFDEETIESVHSTQDHLITIYPNPVTDIAILEFPNPDNQQYSLILTDMTGKVVRTMGQITGSQVEIDRGNLAPGIYIIELRGEKIYRTKLLIE